MADKEYDEVYVVESHSAAAAAGTPNEGFASGTLADADTASGNRGDEGDEEYYDTKRPQF